MNYARDVGWYYISSYDRAAAWTGVEYLYRFLVNNQGVGPFGHEVTKYDVLPGDIVQLGTGDGRFYHSPVITAIYPVLTVSAHTYDALDIRLSSYRSNILRFIHIDGVRT